MAGHWYFLKKNGEVNLFDEEHPMYLRLPGWPTNKDGTPKKRINDATRVFLGLVPGVTDILSVVGGEKTDRLMGWTAKKGIQAGIGATVETLKKTLGTVRRHLYDDSYEEEDIFKDILKGVEDSEEATNKVALLKHKESTTEASDKGTRMHDCIQRYLELAKLDLLPSGELEAEFENHELRACEDVLSWLDKESPGGVFGNKNASLERPFVSNGFGGTIDFQSTLSGVEDVLLVDFKTVSNPKGRKPYPTEGAQIAAYAHSHSLKENGPEEGGIEFRQVNLYIDQNTGKLFNAKEWSDEERRNGYKLFLYTKELFYHLIEMKYPNINQKKGRR
jgi:hypothetical protein